METEERGGRIMEEEKEGKNRIERRRVTRIERRKSRIRRIMDEE